MARAVQRTVTYGPRPRPDPTQPLYPSLHETTATVHSQEPEISSIPTGAFCAQVTAAPPQQPRPKICLLSIDQTPIWSSATWGAIPRTTTTGNPAATQMQRQYRDTLLCHTAETWRSAVHHVPTATMSLGTCHCLSFACSLRTADGPAGHVFAGRRWRQRQPVPRTGGWMVESAQRACCGVRQTRAR